MMMPYDYPSDAELARRARLRNNESYRPVGRFDTATALRIVEELAELGYDVRSTPAGAEHRNVMADTDQFETVAWLVLGASDWRM